MTSLQTDEVSIGYYNFQFGDKPREIEPLAIALRLNFT